jgi:hypothetical protein
MSRYCDCDDYDWEPWMEGQAAGALRSAIRGRRGQQLLRDLVAGLDALPAPELAAGALEDPETGCVCALGAVRLQRGPEAVPLRFDPTDEDVYWRELAKPFDISEQVVEGVYLWATLDGMAGPLPPLPERLAKREQLITRLQSDPEARC